MDISERVKAIIAELLDERRENVCDDTNIEVDLCADSMDKIEVMVALEEAFGIEIVDEEADGLVTVGDVVRCVERKVRQK